jgi:hypothetical protein
LKSILWSGLTAQTIKQRIMGRFNGKQKGSTGGERRCARETAAATRDILRQHKAMRVAQEAKESREFYEAIREDEEEAQLNALEERLYQRAQERDRFPSPPPVVPVHTREEPAAAWHPLVCPFPKNSKIIVIGLTNAAHYNFASGEVMDFAGGRCLVELSGGNTILKIKPNNLKRDPSYY